MKQHVDPRHIRRQIAVKELFAQTFTNQQGISELAKAVLLKADKLDPIIEGAAPTWPINQINKVDLVILRLAIYELQKEKEPIKVIIDEAVELAKEFGSETSGPFINGVLGKIVEGMPINANGGE
ncbi:transcription antitermination factor NusB [Candidatus Microgenomates bacterium]|nr:transcription antitermination factor NusB [Candidatus Microgenomates bacterium]